MIGNRINRARKALGMSLRDLASQVDVSHAAIKKYEDDIVAPSSEMLLKLAKVLKVRAEYFFRQTHKELAKIQFRNHADLPKKHLSGIKASILDHIERRMELEDLFPSPPFERFLLPKLPTMINNYDELEELADGIRLAWQLGLNPIADLIDTLEENGIKFFEINNVSYPKFEGLSASVNNIPIFVVGNQWPGDRQRFTLAHELGHLVLSGRLSRKLDVEKCCDRFAGAFLLPRIAIINILGEHRNNIEPRELSLLKQEFGISMAAIMHRAEDLRIISSNIFKQLRTEFDEKGWSQIEPGVQYPREKTIIFEQMIFHALAEEFISESKAAELMNITIESFRKIRAMDNNNADNYQ